MDIKGDASRLYVNGAMTYVNESVNCHVIGDPCLWLCESNPHPTILYYYFSKEDSVCGY